MIEEWKQELKGAVSLAGIFAEQSGEASSARNALKGAFDAGVTFEEYLKEVEIAVEFRIRNECPEISEIRLRDYKEKARNHALVLERYFR